VIVFDGRGILLDVEGTTSSISFVYDVLFSFAKREVGEFLAARRHDPAVRGAAAALAAEAEDAAPPRREEALAERRRLLEGVIDTYQRRPHAEEAVRDARRLIGDDAPAPAPPEPPEDRP